MKFKNTSNMTLKEKLRRNELTIGSWITLGHSGIAELMANTGGFDWLVIDMEHSVIELRDVQEMLQAIELGGVEPLIRLTSNDGNQIKRVMDAGAHGVVVPFINSKEDAEKAVQSLYYPPMGLRGTGLARAQGYGESFQDYKQWLEKNGVIIAMIEHGKAIENIDEILAVPGIDGYIIGPYDLSASLGVPGIFDDPQVIKAIQKILARGKVAKKPGGIHVVEPDLVKLKAFIEEGFTFIGYGMDIRFLDYICRDHLAQISKFK
ncbi:aldolase/citrate lyase family protein [Rhodospirillales bacterium]|nr:aldolase/citrate lyase family protein [Rhodospirillales bacterium]